MWEYCGESVNRVDFTKKKFLYKLKMELDVSLNLILIRIQTKWNWYGGDPSVLLHSL